MGLLGGAPPSCYSLTPGGSWGGVWFALVVCSKRTRRRNLLCSLVSLVLKELVRPGSYQLGSLPLAHHGTGILHFEYENLL